MSSELQDSLENAQTVLEQARESLATDQARSNQRTYRTTAIFFTLMVIAFLSIVYVFYTTLLSIKQAAPPVATLRIVKSADIQTLCPGDFLFYVLKVNLDRPSTVDIDYTITNLQSGSVIIFSQTERAIYDHSGEVNLQYGWRIPLRPPLQTEDNIDIIGSNFWTSGSYRRSMSATGVEGTFKSSVQSIDYKIGDRCPNILHREDGR